MMFQLMTSPENLKLEMCPLIFVLDKKIEITLYFVHYIPRGLAEPLMLFVKKKKNHGGELDYFFLIKK